MIFLGTQKFLKIFLVHENFSGILWLRLLKNGDNAMLRWTLRRLLHRRQFDDIQFFDVGPILAQHRRIINIFMAWTLISIKHLQFVRLTTIAGWVWDLIGATIGFGPDRAFQWITLLPFKAIKPRKNSHRTAWSFWMKLMTRDLFQYLYFHNWQR